MKLLAIAVGLVAIALNSLAAGAAANDFPQRPISIIVAGAPAGGTDNVARLLASELSQTLGESVVVQNRPGASGIIGTKAVATAAPDGYTLLMGHVATNAIVPALVKPKPYDAVSDFVPVAMVGTAPDLLVVSSESGVQDLAQLLAKGKETGSLTYGSPGVGPPQHIAGFALAKASGVPMVHVPYKGSSPALLDLLGGRIDTMFVTPGAAVPYLASGQLTALAVTSPERSRFFPEVPTVVELGFPSVEEIGWFGVFAPAGTPATVVRTLEDHLKRAFAKPEIRDKLEALYLEPADDPSSQTFAKWVEEEAAKWADVVQRLGVTTE